MATFTVSTTADSGAGSLRQAIASANASAGADSIEFASGLAGNTITLTTGQLVITDNVTINGDADNDGIADITLDGGGTTRLIYVQSGGVLLEELTLQNGAAIGAD